MARVRPPQRSPTLALDQTHAGGFSKTITASELEAIQDTLPGAVDRLQGTTGRERQDSPSDSYGDCNTLATSVREVELEGALAASLESNAQLTAEMWCLRDELSTKLEMFDAHLAQIASP